MLVRFTDNFYNTKMVGEEKNLPDHLAHQLIKSGDAIEVVEVIEKKEQPKRGRKPKA